MDLNLHEVLYGGTLWSVLAYSLAVIAPALAIFFAVFKQSKVVAALAQISDVGERTLQRDMITKQTIEVDRLWYVLGVGNVGITSYLLGAYPVLYYLYFSPKVTALIVLRLVKFYARKQHFLLFDFCYWANFLCLFYCWCMPTSPALFRVVFMVSNGPLAWSVLAFNHAMIFHSYAHVTSVVVHFSPIVLCYGLRWFAAPAGDVLGSKHFMVCETEAACADPTLFSLVYEALTRFYLWWLVIYYLWIFVAMRHYIEERGYQTLWDRILVMKPIGPFLKGLMEKQKWPKFVVQGVYLLIHLLFSTLTMSVAAVLWHSQVANFVFMSSLATATVKNGAEFYFDAFKPYYAAAADKTGVDKKIMAASGALYEVLHDDKSKGGK